MSFFEIVVLPNGDVALKRDNDIDEPIIRISFSKEVDGFAGIDLFDKMDLDIMQKKEINQSTDIPTIIH